MRWYSFLLLILALTGIAACTRITAAPAVPSVPPKAVTSEALVNYHVVSRDGSDIGPVDGVVIDIKSGETQYIIVFIEDIYNFGKGAIHSPQDHYLPIPWSSLTLDAANRQLVVDAETTFVKDAPVFTEPPDTAVAGWDGAVEAYWAK